MTKSLFVFIPGITLGYHKPVFAIFSPLRASQRRHGYGSGDRQQNLATAIVRLSLIPILLARHIFHCT